MSEIISSIVSFDPRRVISASEGDSSLEPLDVPSETQSACAAFSRSSRGCWRRAIVLPNSYFCQQLRRVANFSNSSRERVNRSHSYWFQREANLALFRCVPHVIRNSFARIGSWPSSYWHLHLAIQRCHIAGIDHALSNGLPFSSFRPFTATGGAFSFVVSISHVLRCFSHHYGS